MPEVVEQRVVFDALGDIGTWGSKGYHDLPEHTLWLLSIS